MSPSWVLALATLTMASASGAPAVDCSYHGLLNHLNLSSKNDALANVRPVKDWRNATHVHVHMVVYGIVEVNEKAQTITCQIWNTATWTNEYLRWNSSDFCGIQSVAVRREMLWLPDVFIQEDISDSSANIKSPFISVYFSGVTVAMEVRLLEATCQMDLYMFPLDVQRCNVTFLAFTNDDVWIMKDTSRMSLLSEEYMTTRGEWALTNISILEMQQQTLEYSTYKLIYQITLTRKPMLYIINFIIPLFYFLLLDLATFFISDSRGEKLGIKVTILLSASVLLLILQDILPSTTDQLPLIALYCIIIFTHMTVSLLEAMVVSFLMDKDHHVSNTEPRACVVVADTQMEANVSKEPAKETPGDHFLLELILEEVRTVRRQLSTDPPDEKKKPGFYHSLAEKIDSVFFVVYVVSNLLFGMYMCLSWFVC